jgi:mRNA-degrading endonuclease RelE of RelBE toxin-antitoxin system
MPYKIKFHNNFKKAFKKIVDKALTEEIRGILENILANPTDFEELKHNWVGFQSVHFHRAPEYRILFKLYHCKIQQEATGEVHCDQEQHEDEETELPILQDCLGLIHLVMLGTREEFNNFYKMDKKGVKNYLL